MGKITNITDYQDKKPTADQILEEAKGILDEVVIIGIKDGDTFFFSSSSYEVPFVNWMIDKTKLMILSDED